MRGSRQAAGQADARVGNASAEMQRQAQVSGLYGALAVHLRLWISAVDTGRCEQKMHELHRDHVVLTVQAAVKGPKLRRPEGCRDLVRSVRTAVQQFAAEHGGIASDDSPFPRYWCAHVCAAWNASCHISCQAPAHADCRD